MIAISFISLFLISFLKCAADRKAIKNTSGSVLKLFVICYVILGGLIFFNSPILTHGMFDWTFQQRLFSMIWSLLVALFPVAIIYFNLLRTRKQINNLGFGLLSLFLFIHTIMTCIYVMNPIIAVE